MSSPAPLSDAEKLLAVCRVVWPAKMWMVYTAAYAWVQEAGDCFTPGYKGAKFLPTSLDDLRRVLLALTPGQRRKFDELMDDLRYEAAMLEEGYAWCLTAPTSTILDALYRAVVNQ